MNVLTSAESQQVFRILLDALARPGIIGRLPRAPLAPVMQARFVISHRDPAPASMAELKTGCDDRPHEAALLIQAALVAEQPQPDFLAWQLSGPGVDGTRVIHVAGVSRPFFHARQQLVAHYPQGVDVVLISTAGDVLGIPRATRVFEVVR